MAGRVIHLSKRLTLVPVATNDAAACGFVAQLVQRSRPSAVLLPHVGSDDPLWGTAVAGTASAEPTFVANVIKQQSPAQNSSQGSVCHPSPRELSDIICTGSELNRLLRGAAFRVKDRLTAKRRQDTVMAIAHNADMGSETIKVLDAPLTSVYHAERANRSLRVISGGLPYWALGGYLSRSRSEAQLRELVAEAVFQNKGVSNTLHDTLLELAPDARWLCNLYTAHVMRMAAEACSSWPVSAPSTPSRRSSRRQRPTSTPAHPQQEAVEPSVLVPVPSERCEDLQAAWHAAGAMAAQHDNRATAHCWMDWDTLKVATEASDAPRKVLLSLTPPVPPPTGVSDWTEELETGAALLRLQQRDAQGVPDVPPRVEAATAASLKGGGREHVTPLGWSGDTPPAFDDATLQSRHSLRKVISGLGMEHGDEEGGSDRTAHTSSDGVQWGAYHDRHASSQAQRNDEELWFMPEHVQSPTGTHLRALYAAQLTPHIPKDAIQVQRTAERRAQQLLRRMRYMLSQQRRADAEQMQLAFDAAASVALPRLGETHEVRQHFMRSRALQQEAFSSTSDNTSDDSVHPDAVLPASQLGTYVPPSMTDEYASSYGLNDIVPDFAWKWNVRRERMIEDLQAAADLDAAGRRGSVTDSDSDSGSVSGSVSGSGDHRHGQSHASSAASSRIPRTAPRAQRPPAHDTGRAQVTKDTLAAVLLDGSRRALPNVEAEHHPEQTNLHAYIQQLCLFSGTQEGSSVAQCRPQVPLGPVPLPGTQETHLHAVPLAPASTLLAQDAQDTKTIQRKLGILNALFDCPPESSTHGFAPVAAADLWGWWMRDHNTWPSYWPDLQQEPYSPAAAAAYMEGLTSQRNLLAFDAGRGGASAGFDPRTQGEREEDAAARRFDVTQYDWDI